MSNRVTLQEIADSLGISRNTVSRALNNTGNVSASTRNKICQTALAMGYKQFVSSDQSPLATNTTLPVPNDKTEIALFTHSFPGSSHSGNKLLEAFQHKIDTLGYRITINIIRDYEIENLCFPANIDIENIAGILCIELFDQGYSEFLCSQNIPILFIDTPLTNHCDLQADILYMENVTSVYRLVDSFIKTGKKNIAFLGDRFHCQSFYERWQAYVSALTDNGISVDINNCILDEDSSPYSDPAWISQRISSLKTIPEVFFCANDFLAMSTLRALRLMGKKVPEDVSVCGFDNAPESSLVEPALTTVQIHSSSMGYTAAELLLARIANPNMPYKKTYIETDIIMRDSTK